MCENRLLHKEIVPFLTTPMLDKIHTLINKYPDRLPIQIVAAKELMLTHNRFLVSKSCSFSTFLSTLRTKIDINEKQALFCFVDNKLPKMSSTILELYANKVHEGDILFVTITLENTFG